MKSPLYVFDFCDICDALLTESEHESNPRFGQQVCDRCTNEIRSANPEVSP